MREGSLQEVHLTLAQALDGISSTGESMWLAEVHRVRGLVLFSEYKLAESEAAFSQALYIAREERAKALELRAAISAARLWGEQGHRAEAQALLAPVYSWFTEGFDTADLKNAKALIDMLA